MSLLAVCFLVAVLPARSQAQEVLNDHLEQPEVAHFARPELPAVDAYGGFNLSVPTLTVPGRGMNFQVNLDYSSGITFSQRASWVGLGWSFDPGSITRRPAGALNHYSVMTAYGVDQFDDASAPAAQPDTYYLTLPGRGTVEVTQVNSSSGFADDLGKSLTPAVQEGDFTADEHKPWRIEAEVSSAALSVGGIQTGTSYDEDYDPCFGKSTCHTRPDISRFVVTTGDGTRYVFAQPTLSYFDTRYNLTNGSTQYARQAYVSAWRLVAQLGPGVVQSVPSSLDGWPNDQVPGSWIRFDYSNPTTEQSSTGTLSPYEFRQARFLSAIVTPTHRAEFVSEKRQTPFAEDYVGTDPDGIYRKLTAIELYSRIDGSAEPIKRVVPAYGEGAQGLSPYKNIGGTDVRRLRLEGVQFEGAGGASRPGYAFEYYDAANPNVIATYDTDDFGYYSSSFGSGAVDPDGGQAWSLSAAEYPTGGRLEVNYENDDIADSSIPYVLADGASTSYDAGGALKSRQGGPRVSSLQRDDGLRDPATTTFTYGPGHATGVPPKYWQRNAILTGNDWLFAPDSRGKISVVYEWVRREHPDGSATKTFYTTSGPNPLITTIETIVARDAWGGNTVENDTPRRTCGASQCTDLAVLQGNQHWNWARPYRVEHFAEDDKQVLVVDKNLRPSSKHSKLASVWEYDTGSSGIVSAAVEFGGPIVYDTYTYECPGGAFDCDSALNLSSRETYGYDDNTSLRDSVYKRTWPDLPHRWTKITYAHKQYPGMESQNMLTPVYAEVTENQAATLAKQWTTWSDSDGHWRPREEWAWVGDGSGSDASAPSAPGGSETLRVARYADYDAHGHVIRQLDAKGSPTYFYYGDNAGNRCGGSHQDCVSAGYDGLRHAFLTSVEKAGLSVDADYDVQWGRLGASTDANGRVQSYAYDAFGRLGQVKDDAGSTVRAFAYYYGDPSAEGPLRVETTLYGGAQGPDQMSKSYFDGLGRQIQMQAVTGNGEAAVQRTSYDALGRPFRQWRPVFIDGN